MDGTKVLKCPWAGCSVEHVVPYRVFASGTSTENFRLEVAADLADVYAHAWSHDPVAVRED
jgi:hypothetical protein